MSFVNASEILDYVRKNSFAAGAFNIFNQITAEMVVRAAEKAEVPVILQTSVSTVKQVGMSTLYSYIKPLAETAKIPVALHLDHSTSVETCIACIEAGWTSVMYDGSKESYEKNIKNTLEVVKYAHCRNVSVEGEIGSIVGVEDEIIIKKDESALADPKTAVEFAGITGIDALAPAIGTAHGVYADKPDIRFDLFAEIAQKSECKLVIHGGTGLESDVFTRLIGLGASKINVSTAIKHSYLDALAEALKADNGSYNPLKVDKAVSEHIMTVVDEHINIFCCNRK